MPDEEGVMQLAFLWSIDPSTLDQEFQEPMPGLLGKFEWTAKQPSRWS